jgi:hypothetical protein
MRIQRSGRIEGQASVKIHSSCSRFSKMLMKGTELQFLCVNPGRQQGQKAGKCHINLNFIPYKHLFGRWYALLQDQFQIVRG